MKALESDPHPSFCIKAVSLDMSAGDPDRPWLASKNPERQALETSLAYLEGFVPHQLTSIIRCQMGINSHGNSHLFILTIWLCSEGFNDITGLSSRIARLNTACTIKSEFQINNRYYFSMSMSPKLHRTY